MFQMLPSEVICLSIYFMDTLSIFALLATCRSLRLLATIQLQVDFRQQLHRYLVKPDIILQILDEHDALIGGSLPLRLVDRLADWNPRDVNIYAPPTTYDSLLHALEMHLGATPIVTYPLSSKFINSDQSGVTSFKTFMFEGIELSVACSLDMSPMCPILRGRTTVTMNYIAKSHLCVAYPTLTLAHQGIMHSRLMNDEELDHVSRLLTVQAYELRDCGSNFLSEDEDVPCREKRTCPGTRRSFRDKRCLFIPFVSQPLELPEYMAEWRLGGVACYVTCRAYTPFWYKGRKSGRLILK